MCSRLLWLFLCCRIFSAPGLNTFPLCIRAVCQVPRSIYVTTFFATTRIICALTDIKCSSPKDLSPPTGRPYHVRKYHYSHSPCLGLPHDAVNRAVRHRMNRSLVFLPLFISREKKGHGAPARQLVLSDGTESNLGTPNIQLLKIMRGLLLSLTITGKKIGVLISKTKNYFSFCCRGYLPLTSTGKKNGVSTTKTEK